ncbi:MAG: hypothetical protein M3552_01165 [Planctomycetota bacterium]|nr:hypothetical protein [Planctomycetota bacterium]
MNHGHGANLVLLKKDQKPYATMGAGPLVSTLWKQGEARGGWRYRFNLFRMSSQTGHVSQTFRPQDVPDLVKLVRLLAFSLAEDGCLDAELRSDLMCLSGCIDDVLGTPDGFRAGVLTAYEANALASVVAYLWETEARHFEEHPECFPLMADVLLLRRWLEMNRPGNGSVVRVI